MRHCPDGVKVIYAVVRTADGHELCGECLFFESKCSLAHEGTSGPKACSD